VGRFNQSPVIPPYGGAPEEKTIVVKQRENIMPQFFTPVEAAKILHYNRTTISLKIKSGEIPAVRPSGKLRGRVLIPASYFEQLAAAAIGNAPQQGGK
jgi:excisionase family DNA binding protein